MDEVDEKLRAILQEDIIEPIRYGEGVDAKAYFGIDSEELIPKLKQAFVDAGYIDPEKAKHIQAMVNMMAQTAQDMMRQPLIIKEIK